MFSTHRLMATVTINVGGRIFLTYEETLSALPNTRLARLSRESSPEFDKEHGWFFFDRNPTIFEFVLDLYRSGSLHVPHDMCGGKVMQELDFWEIPLCRMEDCCYDIIRRYNENVERMAYLQTKFEETVVHFPEEQTKQSRMTKLREQIWCIIEYPETSRLAMVYAIIYYALVLVTCITFVISTHHSFRDERKFDPSHINITDEANNTQQILLIDHYKQTMKNPKELLYRITEIKPVIYYLNYVCSCIFAVDLIVRFLVTPSKTMLIKSVLIIFDIILVFTNVVSFLLERNLKVLDNNKTLLFLYVVSRLLIILRLFRLLKLSRHLCGLKVLMLSFRSSFRDLLNLSIPLIITMLLLSAMMYYAEFTDPKTFHNIPIAIWWCVVTMTTVGYGDVTPATHAGYAIASVCALLGLILVALPVAIIASNFDGMRSTNLIRVEKKLLWNGCENKNSVTMSERVDSNGHSWRNSFDSLSQDKNQNMSEMKGLSNYKQNISQPVDFHL